VLRVRRSRSVRNRRQIRSRSAAGGASFVGLFGVRSNAPRVQLDQFWLRFDLWRTLFVTIGRQHVHWGTAHFWSPTDFLHVQRRNPLDTFDARPGTDMLKLHLPIESTNWNFYAYAIAGGYNDTPTLYSVSGAARAEFVAGSNELGLGGRSAARISRASRPTFRRPSAFWICTVRRHCSTCERSIE
jgi:hypothetical protein